MLYKMCEFSSTKLARMRDILVRHPRDIFRSEGSHLDEVKICFKKFFKNVFLNIHI